MNAHVTPYRDSAESKREQIEKMFNSVSGNYDLLNRIITWGMDKGWPNNVLELIVKKSPDTILDIATGTADMAILLSKTNAKYILAVDISQGMLTIANDKIQRLNLQGQIYTEIQDAENLAIPDNSFDVVTITYGIRNFENLEKGLTETLRVTKPGGIMVILETSTPYNPLLKFGYLLYTKLIMPRIASLFSKDKSAYAYLSESAIKFPYGGEFVKILEKTGLKNVRSIPQMCGISTIYYAKK
jgi:demethylmenaquinone methyltransferase/2-methoxy-6-polyprenyl-1,4-benzoquinol methylase